MIIVFIVEENMSSVMYTCNKIKTVFCILILMRVILMNNNNAIYLDSALQNNVSIQFRVART